MRSDITQVLALKQDTLALTGSGANNEPLGILNTSGITLVVLGTNGADPTWKSVVDLETGVANLNADVGVLSYASSVSARGKMKQTIKFANTGFTLWENGTTAGGGMVNGYRALASTQIPNNLTKGTANGVCSVLIFGNWSDLILALWGGLDVVVDNITLAREYSVRVTVNMLHDVGVRHTASFAAIKDMLTA